MRYIRLKDDKPDQAWLDEADKLLEDMKAAPDDAAREAIIKKNEKVWGKLKDWLLSLSHGKCWFSEAKDTFNHWEVEHFRPKRFAKDEDGTEHGGYWWLAFDWENFRICGNVGNRMRISLIWAVDGSPAVRVQPGQASITLVRLWRLWLD